MAVDDDALADVALILAAAGESLLAERDAERDALRAAVAGVLVHANFGAYEPTDIDWTGDIAGLLMSYYRGADGRAEAMAAERDAALARVAALEADIRRLTGGKGGTITPACDAAIRATMAALEAAGKPLAWTTEKPTVTGQYWWRKHKDDPMGVVEVDLRHADGQMLSWGWAGVEKLEDVHGEWAGPIRPPREA